MGIRTRWIIAAALVCRLAGMLLAGDTGLAVRNVVHGHAGEQLLRMFEVNNDELLIAEIALCQRNGLSYSSSHEAKRAGYVYDFTAFRPSYPVYLHIVLQNVFHLLFPGHEIRLDKRDPYFLMYGAALQLVSFLLFFASLFWLRMIAQYFLKPIYCDLTLLLYGLHPAVMLYVGSLVNYEAVTVSLIIINLALLLKLIHSGLTSKEKAVFMAGFLISVLFRPQQLFIYLALLLLMTLMRMQVSKSVRVQMVRLAMGCTILYAVSCIPVVVRNYRIFSTATMGTNGLNFYRGHNPFARGSWCNTCSTDSTEPYYQYIRNEIPGYDALIETEKSKALQKLAISWMVHHPLLELRLCLRKTAVYFIPVNSDHHVFNLFNALYHAGCLLYCLFLAYDAFIRKQPKIAEWILVAPLAGSLLVSLVFYVGYRWRYYAEPFMVVMTMVMIQRFISAWRHRKAIQS